MRINYIESNIEEDIDMKNQYRITNLPDPISIRQAASKNYVDNKFNDSIIIKNNALIDLNDRNIANARFIQVNQLPQNDSHLTAKLHVIQIFIKSTKTISPTGYSGATSLPPIGNSFMYIETSSSNHGNNVFVSFERTDVIQISNITFYYNRFSILTKDSIKSMGRFRIQILLEDNTWSTRYNIPKNDRYSDTSTHWTNLSLNFTEENYGIKLMFDEIDNAHIDMCFSDITITRFV